MLKNQLYTKDKMKIKYIRLITWWSTHVIPSCRRNRNLRSSSAAQWVQDNMGSCSKKPKTNPNKPNIFRRKCPKYKTLWRSKNIVDGG